MNDRCPQCNYVFNRENGYFLGAVVLGYIFAAFSSVPTFIVGILILKEEIFPTLFVACVQVFVITPPLTRFCRQLWIHLDYRASLRNKT
jgi:hypothetical protein